MSSIHKEGIPFIFGSFLLSVLSFLLSSFAHAFFLSLGMLLLFTCLLIVYFFRDPDRTMPKGKNLVLSPADGIVTKITKVPSIDPENSEEMILVSIFLSVFNVHVNRIPYSGTVEKIEYVKGKFVSAMSEESSIKNERNLVVLKTEDNHIIGVQQIAGLIAKRIVCYAKETQRFQTGDRFGIIRFGSRVNLYLPASYKVNVLEGQTTVGAETIIAHIA